MGTIRHTKLPSTIQPVFTTSGTILATILGAANRPRRTFSAKSAVLMSRRSMERRHFEFRRTPSCTSLPLKPRRFDFELLCAA